MIIKKTYAGSQTRQLLPKDGNIGGVIGDSKATTLQFKFPKEYDLGGRDILSSIVIFLMNMAMRFNPDILSLQMSS